MGVEALVDARRDWRAGFDGREVEGDLETVAGYVRARVRPGDFLLRFERAGAVAGLGEEGAGQVCEGLREDRVVRGEEGEEGLLY